MFEGDVITKESGLIGDRSLLCSVNVKLVLVKVRHVLVNARNHVVHQIDVASDGNHGVHDVHQIGVVSDGNHAVHDEHQMGVVSGGNHAVHENVSIDGVHLLEYS